MNTTDIAFLIAERNGSSSSKEYNDRIQVGSQHFEGKLIGLEAKQDRPMGHFIIFDVLKTEGIILEDKITAKFNDVMTIAINDQPFEHVPQ